jgi:hypothetical protein
MPWRASAPPAIPNPNPVPIPVPIPTPQGLRSARTGYVRATPQGPPYVHYAPGRAYGWVASTIPLRAVPMPYLCRTYAVPEARGSLPLGPPRTVRPPRTRTSTTRPTVRTQRPTVRIQRTRSGGFSTPCHLVDLYEQPSSSTTALNLGPAPRINGKRRADSTTSTRLSLSLSLSLALSLTRQTL